MVHIRSPILNILLRTDFWVLGKACAGLCLKKSARPVVLTTLAPESEHFEEDIRQLLSVTAHRDLEFVTQDS